MSGVLVAGCLVGAAVVLVAAGPPRALRLLRRWRPPTLVTLGGVCVGAAGGVAVLGGPVAALLAVAVSAAVARHVRTTRSAKAAATGRAEEIEALAALAAELRSGRQPAAALAAVEAPGAVGAALGAAGRAAAGGGDVLAALRRKGGGLDRLAAAWQVSELTGAPLAAVVDRVEADARAAVGLRGRAWAESAGARATGALLAGLPLLGVGLGQAMGAHPVHVLLHTPLGALCCVVGLALEAAGLAWISRLTRFAVEP